MAALQHSVLNSACSTSRPAVTPCFRAGVSRPRLAARRVSGQRYPASVRASNAEVQEAKEHQAEQRWENQIRNGTVINVSAKDAGGSEEHGWRQLIIGSAS